MNYKAIIKSTEKQQMAVAAVEKTVVKEKTKIL